MVAEEDPSDAWTARGSFGSGPIESFSSSGAKPGWLQQFAGSSLGGPYMPLLGKAYMVTLVTPFPPV
ncbi:MAG: hypothetical protein WCE75_12620, partial [Terracidiphilus sp.]